MFVAEDRVVERAQQVRARERAKAASQVARTTRAEENETAVPQRPGAGRPPAGYRLLRLGLIVVAAGSYVVLLVGRFRGRRVGAT